jgi:hypothetical protein
LIVKKARVAIFWQKNALVTNFGRRALVTRRKSHPARVLYPRPQTLGRSCFRARRRRTSQPPPPPHPSALLCPPVHHSRPSPRCPFELRLSPGCTEREGVRRLRDSAPPCLHVPLNAVLPPRGRGPRPATAVASSSGSRPYRRSDLVGRR